jgi:hypothetical protein
VALALASRVRRLEASREARAHAGSLAPMDPVELAIASGLEPDQWQAELLRSTSSRVLLNVTRQGGKSSTAAILAVWTALYRPGSLVLLVSPSERQSIEVFAKAMHVYHAVGRPVASVSETVTFLTLVTGSRIVALPGIEHTIRGYSGVDLLIEDEAARTDDQLYLACRPMLSVSQGRMILMSTPYGRRGHFYNEWDSGDAAWERYRVEATACPRIPASFLEEERRTLPARWYRQEYCCSFEDTVDTLFSGEDLEAALTTSIKPLFASPLLLGGA